MTAVVKSPPPTRREARRLDRRDCILTVAERYFLEHGYAGTTMSGIAAALGGSKGTLWNHFPSKEELFSAVVDRVVTAYRMQLSQILDPCGLLEPTLLRACRSLLDKVCSPQAIALHRLIYSEGGRFPELSRIFFELAPRHTRALLADFLEGAMNRGQIRRADPTDAARMLMAMTMGGSHQQLLMGQMREPRPEALQADVALAVNLFMRAYAPESTVAATGQSA
ncbi:MULTISPECIES: TetR/AcrR family transcriptional regulator [unclassified Sphingobium]|uniref:TetR/AcrR family transcriptional regulator n=1 Tax=unclassified Sphingobium TaxID=2611147 RepID=UPI000D15C080|nr:MULTISPECIES: TetR/AcrR family transcriptional regulator [unclassified Sphingobium]MBG6118870.1 AcrR family transcriptional regulator [Sphingobium sp. JAI105]PSO13512.1 TetR family transcriptional regulator [Sphingobium sp. AEW4]TWD10500.1 TetR family transcriptional regulator [Sphingobium sp. AEW010]TWD28095.1 TetR family transcriptional regulator [Sphingobium sp. AEW013]TWD28834.1 TetR family transcriptional regulator [Sphingobium sp. AEW001]